MTLARDARSTALKMYRFSKTFDATRPQRIIQRCMFVCWLVGIISLCVLGGIETAAIWQPKEPEGNYIYPHQIKGSVRYITAEQRRLLWMAEPAFIAGIAGFFLLAIPYEALKRHEERRRLERLRDQTPFES
jgi:hypothetical protein